MGLSLRIPPSGQLELHPPPLPVLPLPRILGFRGSLSLSLLSLSLCYLLSDLSLSLSISALSLSAFSPSLTLPKDWLGRPFSRGRAIAPFPILGQCACPLEQAGAGSGGRGREEGGEHGLHVYFREGLHNILPAKRNNMFCCWFCLQVTFHCFCIQNQSSWQNPVTAQCH